MRVVASEPAAALIAERGGRLYVWPTTARCCRAVTRLASATTAPTGRKFVLTESAGAFDVYLPPNLTRRPSELHVDVKRFPRRIESYWDGCAWVI